MKLLNKYIYVFCMVHLGLNMVNAQQKGIDISKKQSVRIDPKNTIGLNVSDVFDEITFIPLETTKESFFGKIKRLEVTKDRFIIYDQDTRAILIFDKMGKFISKINGAKISDDKDNAIDEFRLVMEDMRTLISLQSGKNLFTFDLNGKLVNKGHTKDNTPKYDYLIPDSSTGIKFNKKIDSTYFELSLYDGGGKILNKFFPFAIEQILNDNMINSGKSLFYSGRPGRAFYTRYYDYNIYEIGPDKAELSFQITLPAVNSLPRDFMSNPSYKGKKMEFLLKNTDLYFGIYNVFQSGNNLFFNLSTFGQGKRSFIYNLKNNALVAVSDLAPDHTSYFLPVTDAGAFDEYNNVGFSQYVEGYLYTSYSSLAAFMFKQQSANKKPQYNEILTRYFKTQSKKSNPIIVVLKPKNG
ncbi:6-bladed beta-propeller [Pedobacter miscanthi]|uniref:6-bladed beta-propeller n=1 Tax=Pedobacter miscanthi TaxID=2259170 RepID=A0A366KN46_9SPHI|nr:6-bladed beta-propeller [Pedobacter miscanthi]RBQ02703.1 hypothetical protein DRW42_25500 [Pedobacter miscanthi]